MTEVSYNEADLYIHGSSSYHFNYGIILEEKHEYARSFSYFVAAFQKANNNAMKQEILMKLLQMSYLLISIFPYNYYYYWQHAKYLRFNQQFILSKQYYQKSFILMRSEFTKYQHSSIPFRNNNNSLSLIFNDILSFNFSKQELIDPILSYSDKEAEKEEGRGKINSIENRIFDHIVFEYATLVWKMKDYESYEIYIEYLLSIHPTCSSYLNDYSHYIEYQKEDIFGAIKLIESAIQNDNPLLQPHRAGAFSGHYIRNHNTCPDRPSPLH